MDYKQEAQRILGDIIRKWHVNNSELIDTLQSCNVSSNGDFTIAIVNGKFAGAAKKHHNDRFSHKTGSCYAITRAVKKFVKENRAQK